MSRIRFHNIESTTEVSGCERALMGVYCSRALLFALGDMQPLGKEPLWILNYIPQDCYLHQMKEDESFLVRSIETWLKVGSYDNAALMLDDKTIPLFDLQLNSAVAMGGNSLKLAAKLHGQCELHCYVEGANRNWLADLIKEALGKSIFREGHGWEATCEMLRKANDSPVVCSYSVCESFPNQGVSEWEPESGDEDGDGWYELSHEKKWELSLTALRKNGIGLELRPDRWDSFYFGRYPISGFDFFTHRMKANKL